MSDIVERARRIKAHYELPIGRHPERDKDRALRELAAALLTAEQTNTRLQRLVDQAAVLLHNSTPPRYERWHDDFDQWLAEVRAALADTEQETA